MGKLNNTGDIFIIKNHNSGAILLEFVICFPVLLVLFLFAMQLAQIMITYQVVHYAAYMSGRSAMTANIMERQKRAERVAKRILACVSSSPVNSTSVKDRAPDEYSKLDGWGWLPQTKFLEKQVSVDFGWDAYNPKPGNFSCTVKFKMFLNVPVANRLIAFFARKDKVSKDREWEKQLNKQGVALNPALITGEAQTIELDRKKYPYLELVATRVVSIPYGTMYYPIESIINKP